MATKPKRRLLTERDIEILRALDRIPLTVRQLLKLSRTFAMPFESERRVQERLQALADAGRVHRRLYAVVGSGGAPSYYQLARHGYQLLHEEGRAAPSKRAFSEIGIAHQHHTRCLADFLVHTFVSAFEAGVAIHDFYRENALKLEVGEGTLFPDSAFRVQRPGAVASNFLIELDNGSERIRSLRDVESWERKIRLYESLQDRTKSRFRVLVVCTRNGDRLRHILDAAASLARNPQRSLFYGVHLDGYLAEREALTRYCFLDHSGAAVAALPQIGIKDNRRPAPGGSAASTRRTWLPEALFA